MGKKTKIAWTHHTFNVRWGCQKVSPECDRCYAESFAKRTGHPVWGPVTNSASRRAFGDAYWAAPLAWDREAAEVGERRLVFCSSMADVFEDVTPRVIPTSKDYRKELHVLAQHDMAERMTRERLRLWALIAATPHLTWLLLTKRPENIRRMVPALWADEASWPRNVWVGATAGVRSSLARLSHLLAIPAPVRFVSYEPALERIDYRPHMAAADGVRGIDWLLVGGESGGGSRPFDIQWARDCVAAGAEFGVPVHVKQYGSNAHDSRRSIVGGWSPGDPEPDTRVRTVHLKGEDPREWEPGLRVQLFPDETAVAARRVA